MRKLVLILVLLSWLPVGIYAQPFIQEVNAFAIADVKQPPPARAILMIGSSSFTYWKDVAAYFPEHEFINRAFGGSSLTHQIDYVTKVVYPYTPKQIIIYCGENDIAASHEVTADTVFYRFVKLHALIRKKMPDVPISFVSIKPSPVRAEFLPTVIAANKLIKQFCKKERRTNFIDIFSSMIGSDGKPIEELFLADRLHMNAKGYQIWKNKIAPYLVK